MPLAAPSPRGLFQAALASFLDRSFGVAASGSTLSRELRAGLTTFLTMAYILFVNPDILSQVIPVENARAQLLTATALAAASGSILMGVLARYPYAQAPGMGLNAYFAFSVVLGQKVPWQTALGAVFVVGLVFTLLSQGGIRQALLRSLPHNLKFAMTAGVGLFLAFIGLRKAGLVVADSQTLVTLGSLRAATPALALVGLYVTVTLQALRVPAAILIGIAVTTGLAIATGAAVYPGAGGELVRFAGLDGSPVRLPVWPRDLFLALDIKGALSWPLLGVLFTMLFVAIDDTAGTLIGLSARAGFLDREGELPRAGRAFTSDALASCIGALFGSSTTTAYIESAAGIEEGGRTGLVAVVVGLLFLGASCAWPLLAVVPGVATAPALILVGAMMITNLRFIAWGEHGDYTEIIPVFLTLIAMPLTYSIANGVGLGVLSYAVLKLLTGRRREVRPLLWGVAALVALRYAFL